MKKSTGPKKTSKKAKAVAVCAMFAALGVVAIGAAAVLDVLDMFLALFASAFIFIAVIEFGAPAALAVWLATSALSLILFPHNTAAWMYLIFTGWYPVFKRSVEKLHYVISWIVKLSAFNTCCLVYWLVATKVLLIPTELFGWLIPVFALVINAAFIMFDIAASKLITLYIFRWRRRLGFKD
ncbi:MAG: hypothetical protein IJV00_09945 [Clostridia bacterium]|nr:hypothetical protein [Clostridia bacterium]